MSSSSPQRSTAQALAEAFSDFRSFAGLLDIVNKGGQRQKLTLNEIQRAYCRARTGRDVALKPRQVGFTTLEQARDIFHFLTRPGARVVATCQSMTDHTPRKVLAKNYDVMFGSLERLGIRLNWKTKTGSEWVLDDRDASLRIIEAGASEAAAEKKGRAGTITRLHLTETAFYEYADATLNALLECVPAPEFGSEIVSESTPNGAHGTFYRQCKSAIAGTSGFRFHFFPWFSAREYAVPLDEGERVEPRNERERLLVERYGLRPEQLKWYQRKVASRGDAELVAQEYPNDPDTCFLVSGRCFFDLALIAEAIAGAAEPIAVEDRGRLRIWQQPQRGSSYVIGADTAEGGGGDPSAALVYERGTGQHVATMHGQYIPWDFAGALVALGRRYNGAAIAPERNNHGHAVIQAMQREHRYGRLYVHHDGKPGWLTNEASRAPMLDALDASHRRGTFNTNDTAFLGQMRTFVITDSGKAEAAKGEQDDLIMGGAIGWAVLTRPGVHRDMSALDRGFGYG